MDTFLKYLPILPATVAAYMGARAVISDIRAIRSANKDAGTIPFWRRQIVVMIILVILAWIPFLISLFSPSTAEDTERATAAAKSERVIPPPVVSPPTPQPEWSAQEIAARVDLWHSIQNAVNDVSSPAGPVVAAYNYGDFALNIWVTYLPKNRPDYLGGLKEFRKKVSEAADGVQKIRRDYPNFKDVSETIDQSYLGPLLDSIDNLSTAISALPEPLPPNYETTLRPLVGAVRVQMNNFHDWISNVQSTSKTKLNQLQIMSHK
jgi:hypothetical protein